MAEITTADTLEAFAESAIKELLEAQCSYFQDHEIHCGHAVDLYADEEGRALTVTLIREEEEPAGTGWWSSSVEVEADPRTLSDAEIESAWLEIETALGNGDGDIESQIEATAAAGSRLKVMAGSVFYDQPHDYEPSDGERFRYWRMSGSFGLLAPA